MRAEGAVYAEQGLAAHHTLGGGGDLGRHGATAAEHPELRTRRQALVEHPFGTMKRWRDQGYFLMRGLVKVRTEFSLTVLAYNLTRVINLVGVPRMIAALP